MLLRILTHNSASDGTDIKLSEMALAITRMEQQQLVMLAAIKGNATTADATATTASTTVSVTKQKNTKQIVNTMLTSENKVVAATLHNTHFDSNSDHNSASDSGAISTDTGTSIDDSNSISIDNNAGIGPILDMTSYNRFESTLAKLQVHASDIVRVDNQAIGTGGFAKVYKVLLKGNQLCAAKVSATIDTYHALLLHCIHATSYMLCYINCALHGVMNKSRL
jgi:hypothetical protein